MGTLYQAARKRIKNLLLQILPEEKLTQDFLDQLYVLIEKHLEEVTCGLTKWDHSDTVLITCGGSMLNGEEPPLQKLHTFLHQHLRDEIRCVHIAPSSPYTDEESFLASDDYRVNPALGSWQDIQAIHQDFDLMTDLVTNPATNQSQRSQNFLKGEPPTKDYLLEMLRVLFYYIHQGARIIRLNDAAGLWKEQGPSGIRQTQNHRLLKLIRELAELIHPDTIILAETNLPERENLSFFGEKFDEAHMISQLPLPPMILHTLHTGDATRLSQWAATIPDTDEEATFFNFTASQKGIDIRPLEGIIPEDELSRLLERMKEFGGDISTRTDSGGSESYREININWLDAMKGTFYGVDTLQTERFLCSQTIMMEMRGIPAFYIHTLTATESDYPAKGFLHELKRLIGIRRSEPAFHPNAAQHILDRGPEFFALRRTDESGRSLWAVSNVTARKQRTNLNDLNTPPGLHDVISGKTFQPGQTILLEPYQTLWLKQKEG